MKHDKGFTLVEIMIVVAIIGLLVAIGVPAFMIARGNARKNTCYNNMRVIAHAVQQYSISNDIPSGEDIELYDDNLMPSGTDRNNELHVPRHLVCPEDDSDYGPAGGVSNNALDVTCGSTEHGSYPDLI